MIEGHRFVPIVKLGGWTRGLTFCRSYAFVATSRVLPRFHHYAPGLDPGKSVCGLHAIDLKTGTKAWETPLAPNLGGPIATAGGLVFLAATIDPFIRAFDIDDGRELWRAELPGGGKATPMTYRGRDGRQYVVIAAGGDGETWKPSDAIVAFALPGQ